MTRMYAPALKGGLLALLAAALFGLSTPLVQHFGQGLGAFTTAALLYGGAAVVALAMRQPPEREASLRRSDLPRILAMAGFGAVVGPVALAWGLQRTSGTSASLMLTLEALFTAVLAWRLYGETMDKRVGTAMSPCSTPMPMCRMPTICIHIELPGGQRGQLAHPAAQSPPHQRTHHDHPYHPGFVTYQGHTRRQCQQQCRPVNI